MGLFADTTTAASGQQLKPQNPAAAYLADPFKALADPEGFRDAAQTPVTPPLPKALQGYLSDPWSAVGDGYQGFADSAKSWEDQMAGVAPPPAAPMADPFASLGQGAPPTQGTPIPGAEGLDMLKPGAAETFFKQTGSQYQDPSMSEQYAKDAMAKYGAGTPKVSNEASGALQDFKNQTPADMGLYYDNAKRRAEETINKSLAARGAYGGSAANDAISEAYTNLDADRAQKEAGYGLDRARLEGTLSSSADQSSAAGSADARQWLAGLGNVAGNADQAELARLTSGQAAAGAAQGAQTVRGQNMFNNNLQLGNAMSNTMGEAYAPAFGNDKDLFAQYLSGLVGSGTEQQGQATAAAATDQIQQKNLLDTIGNGAKLYEGWKQRQKSA